MSMLYPKLNQFTSELIEELINITNRSIARGHAYCNSINKQTKTIESMIITCQQFCQQNNHCASFIQVYMNAFKELKFDLEKEKISVDRRIQSYRDAYLPILQSVQLSFLEDEKKIIKFSMGKLLQFQDSIQERIKQINDIKEQIEQLKIESFLEMMSIFNNFNYQKVKTGFICKESQQKKLLFDNKKNIINKLIKGVQEFHDLMLKKIENIRQIQQERNILLEKSKQKITKLNINKIDMIQKLCLQINPLYEKQQSNFSFPFLTIATINFKKIEIQQFKQFYTQTINYLFTKRSRVQVRSVSQTKIKQQQNKINLYHSQQIDLTIFSQFYDSQINFIKCIENSLSQNNDPKTIQFKNFINYFTKNIRKHQLKEAFLYFLYIHCKNEQFQQSQLLSEMMYAFVNQISEGNKGQGNLGIKMMIFGHKEGVLGLQRLKIHKLWHAAQFWQCAFLSSIFEFLQIISDQKQKQLSQYFAIQNRQQQSGSWLKSIFRSKMNQQQKLKSKQKLLIKYYYEQVTSLALLFLLVMNWLEIDRDQIEHFEGLVKLAIKQPSIEETKQFKNNLTKVKEMNKEEIQKIIFDNGILQTMMATAEEDEECQLLPTVIKRLIRTQ